MYNWRSRTQDPCDSAVRVEFKKYLLSRRRTFLGSLVDFFSAACAKKSVLHLGFVEHSEGHINSATWKHAAIAASARRAVGVDIISEGVAAARRLGYEGHVLDVTGPDSLGEKFDVVIAGDIIEHLMSLEAVYTFSRRHMDRNSTLFISSPNPTCGLWLPEILAGGTFVSNFEHTCWISPSQAHEQASRVGMDLRHYYPVLGGASLTKIGKTFKGLVYRLCPEFASGTYVYELGLPSS